MDVWQISNVNCATQCFVRVNTNGRWMLRGSAGQRSRMSSKRAQAVMFSFIRLLTSRYIATLKMHQESSRADPTQGGEVVLSCSLESYSRTIHISRQDAQQYSQPNVQNFSATNP